MVGGIENEGESMPRTRRSHPASLKAKVAVEAIKAHKRTAQIAQMFGLHPAQVRGWKKQALAGLPDAVGNGREQMREQADAEKDDLYKQIGQPNVALDFSKFAGTIVSVRHFLVHDIPRFHLDFPRLRVQCR
jgi:transposase